ncbi:hypothetical protein TNIN_138451 [Trichonephila inaurata madagascariensis]|uniref:Uncharacterized protein n=1 Tax=Trichonephila inaurata madagascariensis TaxID=2747483 RepID=A0A8X6X4Q7_9ARAC|nr:hypothetical protein TNIN_138451 [Trichonephila inaurata madagascariensis]
MFICYSCTKSGSSREFLQRLLRHKQGILKNIVSVYGNITVLANVTGFLQSGPLFMTKTEQVGHLRLLIPFFKKQEKSVSLQEKPIYMNQKRRNIVSATGGKLLLVLGE